MLKYTGSKQVINNYGKAGSHSDPALCLETQTYQTAPDANYKRYFNCSMNISGVRHFGKIRECEAGVVKHSHASPSCGKDGCCSD